MNSWIHEFMIMNSSMISLSWIHQHEFRNEFIYMNSDIWIHDILYHHEFISEFILWIHIRFHDHKFICDISRPMNSYMNSCTWRISWNYTWNHLYQGSRWWSLRFEEELRDPPLPRGGSQAWRWIMMKQMAWVPLEEYPSITQFRITSIIAGPGPHRDPQIWNFRVI